MAVIRRLPPDVVASIRAAFMSPEQPKVETIAFEHGVSAQTVADHVSDLPRRRPHEEKKRLQAIYMASLGVYEREIAARLKWPLRSVLRALAKPPPLPPTPEERAATEARWREEQKSKRVVRAAEESQRKVTNAKQRERYAQDPEICRFGTRERRRIARMPSETFEQAGAKRAAKQSLRWELRRMRHAAKLAAELDAMAAAMPPPTLDA